MRDQPVIQTKELKKYFGQSSSIWDTLLRRESDQIQAVDGVSLDIHKDRAVGIVGESGCGKSTLLKTIVGLEQPTEGQISYQGKPTDEFNRKEWKEFRQNISLIFQDPYNSLNPRMTVREILTDVLSIHGYDDTEQRIRDTLSRVELAPPELFIDSYPEELSGGERQRVSMARALIKDPDVLLADEPVSALDVSTQAAILDLIKRLREENEMSLIYISHDLSTASYICDEFNVMYLGRIVERGKTEEVIHNPKHPYTQALLQAVPTPDPHEKRERVDLDGSPREPTGIGNSCRFKERCPEKMSICKEEKPRFIEHDNGQVACHLYDDHEEVKNDVVTSN